MEQRKTEQTLLDSFISRCLVVGMDGYSPLLNEVAEHTTASILDDIERNAIIEALAGNKAITANKRVISNALTKLENDIRGKTRQGIEGGLGTYQLRDDGVYKLTDNSDVRICSRLEVLAETRTVDSGDWGKYLQFEDKDHKVHNWAMPNSITAGDSVNVTSVLLSEGLVIRYRSEKNVVDYIMSVESGNRLYNTDRTGWHGEAFITPDKIYGSDEYVFQSAGRSSAALSTKGTLQEWQDNVAAMAVGNSRLVFAISTAFAGALLQVTDEQSGGFHFHGKSSDGKSTAQFVAASVWGKPKEYKRTWRATSNSIEAISALHNDGLLILDEIGMANPKEIGSTAYMLAGEEGKSRMHKNTSLRDTKAWQLIFLSSGELTLAEMMDNQHQRSFAGQELRLANIPSNVGKGMGVFETIHHADNSGEFAKQITRAFNQYYGTAGDKWLEVLTENTQWQTGINEQISQITKHLEGGRSASNQAGRVAARFALVAHAGEMATTSGITGWKAGEATAAAKTCFQTWLDEWGDGDREDYKILKQVRRFLESQVTRFERVYRDGSGFNNTVRDRVGFIVRGGEVGMDTPSDDLGNDETWVLSSQLTELAPDYSASQVKEALHSDGWISSTTGERKTFVKGAGQSRCFKITLPDDDNCIKVSLPDSGDGRDSTLSPPDDPLDNLFG